MKRPACSSSAAQPAGSSALDAVDVGRWPLLMEFLTAAEWEGGERREPGTLLFFLDETVVKVCLNERSLGLVAFVTGSGVTGCCDAAEQLLANGRLDWRKAKFPRGGKR